MVEVDEVGLDVVLVLVVDVDLVPEELDVELVVEVVEVDALLLDVELALHTTVHRASCVSLPPRSAKRRFQAYIHKSTDFPRLPRFRTASHVHAHARGRLIS